MYLRPFAIVLVACLVMASVACGGDDNGADPTQATTTAAPTSSISGSPAVPTKASGTLVLGSTTTTQDTGLLDVLVEEFESRTGYNVQLITGGSGQIIEQASRGDVDALLVHSPAAEKEMVSAGDALDRTLVMHNDFVIIGPSDDPAGVKAATAASDAFAKIAAAASPFVSRGDESGTHVKELAIWKAAAIEPAGQDWYAETGLGQGATMQVANQRGGYALTDRGTFLAQRDELDLEIVFEGDKALLNVYHALRVNPERHDNINVDAGIAFLEFITSAEIQALISEFGVEEYGEPLFTPDAGKPEPVE